MSFRERFQGKLALVNKKGLKHTLFDNRFHTNTDYPAHRNTFTHPKDTELKLKTLPRDRRTTFHEIPTTKTQIFHAETRSQNNIDITCGKEVPLFIDQMLQKHKRLLKLLDRKSSYKRGGSKLKSND